MITKNRTSTARNPPAFPQKPSSPNLGSQQTASTSNPLFHMFPQAAFPLRPRRQPSVLIGAPRHVNTTNDVPDAAATEADSQRYRNTDTTQAKGGNKRDRYQQTRGQNVEALLSACDTCPGGGCATDRGQHSGQSANRTGYQQKRQQTRTDTKPEKQTLDLLVVTFRTRASF